ncbi:MAG TPA: TerD family protein [Bacteroidetes bacterium]|nr:TerD family protein [Bacteroidota bacterium]
MAINLQKGQNISLNKEAPGLNHIHTGLGWDTQQFAGADFDLDVMVFLLGANDKLVSDSHFVFYNNLTSPDGSVVHTGDNLTGEGEGDDEVVNIDLSKISAEVHKIAFTTNIHEAAARNQNFGQVQNAFIRIVDKAKGEEIIRYDLSEDFSIETSLIVAELYRKGDEWKFKAVGQGFKDGLAQLGRFYGLNV